MSKQRHIYDPIHSHYTLPVDLWPFIDNPVYQRLRELKQLGTSHYVFPGATHTRFEHCLGVGYLSGKYMRTLKKQQPELELTDSDIRNVTLAGLLHDLGHGPFSHTFDSDIVPALGITGWSHEQASVSLFEYMTEEYNLDISSENIRIVSEMILGSQNSFKYQIVNNTMNSIDVDKFDYIERDCHSLGFRGFPHDIQRLITNSRVIDDIICYNEKVVHSVYSLFSSRFSLFQQCYAHKVSQAIGLMLADAILAANPVLNIKEKVSNPAEYSLLTDSIINHIVLQDDPGLSSAKRILNKIKSRELYKMAGQTIYSPNSRLSSITPQDISSCNQTTEDLRPEDIIVKKFKLTYGNPAENVWFFSENSKFLIPPEKVSSLIPANYCDSYLRVFVRDPSKVQAAKKAFEAFCKRQS